MHHTIDKGFPDRPRRFRRRAGTYRSRARLATGANRPRTRPAARAVLALAVIVVMVGCGRRGPRPSGQQLDFWNALRALCGQSFAGELIDASAADTTLAGQRLVLNVWQCYHNEIRLAFHVGDDHSRVWLISPVESGLRLTHAIHTADGEPDPYSGYGGETRDEGTRSRQVFAPDVNTVARVPASAGTYWTLDIMPRQRLTYAYHGPDGGQRFRVDFDLSKQVVRPPSPWGFTRVRGPLPADTPEDRS